MVFIDMHCHIDFYKDEEIEKIIERARKENVGIIVNNSVKTENMSRVMKLAEKYEEVKAGLGIYPIDVLPLNDKEFEKEIEYIRKNKDGIVVIGEVGLDYKEDAEEHDKQKDVFRRFISLSIELNKPIIVHSRKAEGECIQILEEMKAKKVIMHCFSGKLSLVKRIIENKWFLTIPTSVKNSEHFQKVISMTPIKQLLCETDSPYLHPDKKMNNEPANVVESYKKIAEIKGISLNEAEKMIGENYNRLVA